MLSLLNIVMFRLELTLPFKKTSENKLKIFLIPNFDLSEKIRKAVNK